MYLRTMRGEKERGCGEGEADGSEWKKESEKKGDWRREGKTPRKRGWESRDSCTMSRVTSCRLPRVFSFPSPILLFLSFSLFFSSLVLRLSSSTTATSLPMCALAAPSRVFRLLRTRFVSSPLSERYPPTRAGCQVYRRYPTTPRSRDILRRRRRHRALMLSYMICLTLPLAQPSGLSSPVPFLSVFSLADMRMQFGS